MYWCEENKNFCSNTVLRTSKRANMNFITTWNNFARTQYIKSLSLIPMGLLSSVAYTRMIIALSSHCTYDNILTTVPFCIIENAKPRYVKCEIVLSTNSFNFYRFWLMIYSSATFFKPKSHLEQYLQFLCAIPKLSDLESPLSRENRISKAQHRLYFSRCWAFAYLSRFSSWSRNSIWPLQRRTWALKICFFERPTTTSS